LNGFTLTLPSNGSKSRILASRLGLAMIIINKFKEIGSHPVPNIGDAAVERSNSKKSLK